MLYKLPPAGQVSHSLTLYHGTRRPKIIPDKRISFLRLNNDFIQDLLPSREEIWTESLLCPCPVFIDHVFSISLVKPNIEGYQALEFLIRLVSQRHQGPTSIHYRTQTFGMVNVTNLEIKYGCETNFIQRKTHVVKLFQPKFL